MTEMQEKVAAMAVAAVRDHVRKYGGFGITVYIAYKMVGGELITKTFILEFDSDQAKARQHKKVQKQINKGTWTNVVMASEVFMGKKWPARDDPDRRDAIFIVSEERGEEAIGIIIELNNGRLESPQYTGTAPMGAMLIWPPVMVTH
jgi:hypothetical protein